MKTDHVVIRFAEGDWHCNNCGQSYVPPRDFQPMYMYLAMLEAFIKKHEHCEKVDNPQ